MSSNSGSNPMAANVSVHNQSVHKYHQDFFYLGKAVLRLGICIFVVTLIAKLAFGNDVSPILVTVLCIVSVVFVIFGIIRIAYSYSALRTVQNHNSSDSVEVSTISNFRAFIQSNSNRQQNISEPQLRRPIVPFPETIHCGNRTFGQPSLVSPPSYEPPPSYEQIQKDFKQFEHLEVKT